MQVPVFTLHVLYRELIFVSLGKSFRTVRTKLLASVTLRL